MAHLILIVCVLLVSLALAGLSFAQEGEAADPGGLHRHPAPDDPLLAKAVAMIDTGDAAGLRQLLVEYPGLVRQRLKGGHDWYTQGYFKDATLLHFVAANPCFEGERLPENLVEIAGVILDAGAEVDAGCGEDGQGTTLGLVASGMRVRQNGLQEPLIRLLVERGADPDHAIGAALGENEPEAARLLLELGATKTLPVVAALGDQAVVNRMIRDASDLDRRRALALAALHGRRRCVEMLVDRGVDPNQLNPPGTHAHATPLHNAVNGNHPETVVVLVTRGADMRAKDTMWDADAFGWAEYMGHDEVLATLKQCDTFMPGIEAVRTGDLDALDRWLAEHPDLVNAHLPGNGRSLLHHVTDWPGGRPKRAAVIARLIDAGADPNIRYAGQAHNETPLHWAASADDVEAIDALLDGGADINALGGVETGGTPLHDAVIFQQRKAAARLLERGAAYDLQLAAGSGRFDLVQSMFDDHGNLRDDAPRIKGLNPDEPKQHRINWAFYLAAMAGDVQTLAFLHSKASEFVTLPDGRTVVDRAIQHKRSEAEAWLREHGFKTKAELEAELETEGASDE